MHRLGSCKGHAAAPPVCLIPQLANQPACGPPPYGTHVTLWPQSISPCSTRESPEMRRELLKVGMSQMSAGSKTDVGAYHRQAWERGSGRACRKWASLVGWVGIERVSFQGGLFGRDVAGSRSWVFSWHPVRVAGLGRRLQTEAGDYLLHCAALSLVWPHNWPHKLPHI